MIRWGILATGNIANKFVQTIQGIPDEAKVIACASRSKEKARMFAEQYSIAKHYGSYEELVEDEEVDAIYICTPNHLHFENMKLCIEAGKSVLCEKPFTTNADEAREIFALAKEKGVFVMEAFWITMLPLHQKLQHLLEEGVIGDVRHLRAEYGFIANGARRERKFDPSLAGGALLDIGIYNIGFASMVFGYEPSKLLSTVHMNEYGTDDFETMILEYEDGKTASLTSTIGMAIPTEGVIYGSKGKITLPDYQKAERMLIELYDGTKEEIHMPFEVNGFEYQVREVARCIQTGEITSSIQTPEKTVAVMEIMDTCRKQWNLDFTTK